MKKLFEIKYFYEEKYYSEKNIEDILEEKYYNTIISQLKSKRILKIKENNYKFSYVGILIFQKYHLIIMVLPKYLKLFKLSKEKKTKITKQIIRVLKKYSSEKLSEEELETIGINFDLDKFNKISLVDYLLNDYINYGVYTNNQETTELNGNGSIHWKETIDNEIPYISNNQFIYLDYITNSSEVNEDDYLRSLHKYILNSCSNFVDKIKIFEELDYPKLDFLVDESFLGTQDFMLNKIKKELQLQFSERKIRLLKSMYSFIKNETSTSSEESLIFYGTKAFYYVWEKACGQVIGNEYENTDYKIPKPKWIDLKTKTSTEKDTIIPDIIKKTDEYFYIFDAKYYNLNFNEDGFISNKPPSVNDIIKQYCYEVAYRKYEENIKNFFVVPCYNKKDKIIGEVKLDLFSYLDSIKILRLDANDIFKKYLNNSEFTEENLLLKITSKI